MFEETIAICSKNEVGLVSDSLNDEELIKGLKQGNEASQLEFVRIYGPRLGFFIRKNFGLAYADIDEIVQESFYKVITNIQKYHTGHGAKFSTWVFGIAINVAKDWLRKNRKQPCFIPYGDEISNQIVKPPNGEELSGKGLLVREALSKLDPVDREILERHLHGVKLVEIAKYLGMEEGTVRQRKLRGLERLKGIYEHLLNERRIRLGSGRR